MPGRLMSSDDHGKASRQLLLMYSTEEAHPYCKTTCALCGLGAVDDGMWSYVAQSALRFSTELKMTLTRILILLPPRQCAGTIGMSHHSVFAVLGDVVEICAMGSSRHSNVLLPG